MAEIKKSPLLFYFMSYFANQNIQGEEATRRKDLSKKRGSVFHRDTSELAPELAEPFFSFMAHVLWLFGGGGEGSGGV